MASSTRGQEAGHNRHIKRISEALKHVRGLLLDIGMQPAFNVAYMDYDRPNETHLQLQSALFDYYEQVAPMEQQIRDKSRVQAEVAEGTQIEANLWDQVVHKADVPVRRVDDRDLSRQERQRLEYHLAMADDHPHVNTFDDDGGGEIETEKKPISLAGLPEWRNAVRRHDRARKVPGIGEIPEPRRFQLAIPLEGAWQVYGQLNRCLEVLGLTVEIEPDPYMGGTKPGL